MTIELTNEERRTCDLIESRASLLLEDLKRHVETPTGPGGGEGIKATRAIFTERMKKLGANDSIVEGQPRPAWLKGGAADGIPPTAVLERLRPGMQKVLIAGHLDTVHPIDSPFRELTISEDNKTALGPGCVDMKGGLVIAACALECLEEAGAPASWTFMLNADEETGSYHSEAALRDQATLHDFGLALEPALPGGELAVERMGSGQFMIESLGRSSHVGRDFRGGVSAVTALARAIAAIGEMADPTKEGSYIMSIGPLQGGTATNAVPDHAAAWGNARYRDNGIAEEMGKALDALGTKNQACEGTKAAVIIRRSFNRPAKPLTPATESLALSARAVAEVLGQQLPFASTGGVCDGNILQDAGLPTIDTLGVRGGGLHTPTEWIELSSLVERCKLLAVLISRLGRGA
ncbi:MAG: M20/M25/M40 family metallo-hydrolase [Phycisphaera sp.]|nr:MAG: M20/M25/M40 family metallo-hydrolase [Phycisphaera sp.]